MEISSNYTSIQVLLSNSKSNILSTSEVSKNYQTEMDKLDLSPQSVAISKEVTTPEYSDDEIAEFLKDKPYTAFKYDFYNTYAPDYAKEFIINEIMHYDYQGFNPPRHKLVSYDKYAHSNNMTSEDIKSDLNKYNLLRMAEQINDGLYGFESVIKYREDYGISVNLNIEDSYFNYFGFDTSIMYQDIKVTDDGEIMILPKNSDKWLTREEFIEICPEYEMFSTRNISDNKEYKLVLSQGEEAYKKYVEDFIAGLSEEEIQILKDYDIFASPAFATTGIEGLEQFTKDIDDINTAEVRQWTGLNERREELIQLAEEQKLKFAKKRAEGVSNYPLYEVIPYTSNSERDAKLIAELGLSDYIKIDTSNINTSNDKINGYSYDKELFEQYSECYYIPERDNKLYQNIEAISNDEYFALSETEQKQYDEYILQVTQQIDAEYQSMLSMYGSAKNIEKAYLYALDNNLSLDILSNNYSSAIGVEVTSNKELHSNLNGRDDFLESIFNKENNNTANQETNITINIELDLKSKYLSKLTNNNNIDTLLDII